MGDLLSSQGGTSGVAVEQSSTSVEPVASTMNFDESIGATAPGGGVVDLQVRPWSQQGPSPFSINGVQRPNETVRIFNDCLSLADFDAQTGGAGFVAATALNSGIGFLQIDATNPTDQASATLGVVNGTWPIQNMGTVVFDARVRAVAAAGPAVGDDYRFMIGWLLNAVPNDFSFTTAVFGASFTDFGNARWNVIVDGVGIAGPAIVEDTGVSIDFTSINCHRFTVIWDAGAGEFRFYIDGVLTNDISFSAVNLSESLAGIAVTNIDYSLGTLALQPDWFDLGVTADRSGTGMTP